MNVYDRWGCGGKNTVEVNGHGLRYSPYSYCKIEKERRRLKKKRMAKKFSQKQNKRRK